MPSKVHLTHLKDLSTITVEVFRLSETSVLIINAISLDRKALPIKEIVKRVQRSERSIRSALRDLVEIGIIQRRVSVTDSKRLSYTYSIRSFDQLVDVTRREILNQLERLEQLEGKHIQSIR
jgi:predicted transcriptional regulator